MRYKKLITLSAVLTFPFLFVQFSYKKSAGSHPGSTGAPADNTCAKSGCHTGTPVTYNDTTVNKFIFSQPDSTYVPGMTYTITIKTFNPGVQRFGFEAQAIRDATATETGTVNITDPTRTHIVTHTTGGGDVRTSATHGTPGTPAITPGYNEWTFDWVAPSTNEGDITFYYATNSTNNNNMSSGDAIFLNTFKIRPFSPSSINEFIDEHTANAYYNSQTNQIILNYNLKADKKVSVKVIDNTGREVFKQSSRNKAMGQQKDELSLNDLSNGIYYVNITVGNRSISKKVLINNK